MQKRENEKVELDGFSEKVFSTSHLRQAKFKSTQFDQIKCKLGPFIEDTLGNIYYDLRMSSVKPFWGHGLPLLLKENIKNKDKLPEKIISFNNLDQTTNINDAYLVKDVFFSEKTLLPEKLNNLSDLSLYFSDEIILKYSFGKLVEKNNENEGLINFIETILVTGSRVNNIQEKIKLFCKSSPALSARGLNIVLKDSHKTQNDFAKKCIHITESNMINDSLFLNLPSSFANKDLDDLFERITHVLRN